MDDRGSTRRQLGRKTRLACMRPPPPPVPARPPPPGRLLRYADAWSQSETGTIRAGVARRGGQRLPSTAGGGCFFFFWTAAATPHDPQAPPFLPSPLTFGRARAQVKVEHGDRVSGGGEEPPSRERKKKSCESVFHFFHPKNTKTLQRSHHSSHAESLRLPRPHATRLVGALERCPPDQKTQPSHSRSTPRADSFVIGPRFPHVHTPC